MLAEQMILQLSNLAVGALAATWSSASVYQQCEVSNDALLAQAQLDWKIREGSAAKGLFSVEPGMTQVQALTLMTVPDLARRVFSQLVAIVLTLWQLWQR